MASFPVEVFTSSLSMQLARTIRPPSKKHLGKELRASERVVTTLEIWNNQLSEARGLPASIASKDPNLPDLSRTEEGTLKPITTTAAWESHRITLQDPRHVAAFCQFQKRVPARGMGAALLVLPSKAMRKHGARATKVAMAAGPFTLRAKFPRGKMRQQKLPYLSYKTNVVMMDENADVTFGVKEYPPWVRCSHSKLDPRARHAARD